MHLIKSHGLDNMPVQIGRPWVVRLSWDCYAAMIEDVELTRKILEHFAQDEVGFPANLSYEDICSAFGDTDQQTIAFHLWCACDAGLLEGSCNEKELMDGWQVTFGWFLGLNIRGSNYVHDSRGSLWAKAVKRLKEHKATVTTAAIVEILPVLLKETLEI